MNTRVHVSTELTAEHVVWSVREILILLAICLYARCVELRLVPNEEIGPGRRAIG